MAVKGAILKQEISSKILETFSNSFLYNDGKEIRINGEENGAPIQVKVTLTCAKVPVEENEINFEEKSATSVKTSAEAGENIPQEPTAEEKERLAMLLNKLGL